MNEVQWAWRHYNVYATVSAVNNPVWNLTSKQHRAVFIVIMWTWYWLIPNDQFDDALPLLLRVYLSWELIASQWYRFHSHISDVLFFHFNGDSLYNRMCNMTCNNTSEIYHRLDCVTVRFPEPVFVTHVPERLRLCKLCNCHMPRGLQLKYMFLFLTLSHQTQQATKKEMSGHALYPRGYLDIQLINIWIRKWLYICVCVCHIWYMLSF